MYVKWIKVVCLLDLSVSLKHTLAKQQFAVSSISWLVVWLIWFQRPFETVFQSISGRLPKKVGWLVGLGLAAL